LPPGSFNLTGRIQAMNLKSERGFWWRVTCADEGRRELGASERFLGTIAWRGFELAFDVPSENCGAQWLTLEHAARVAVEQQVGGGAIAFDDLVVERTGRPS